MSTIYQPQPFLSPSRSSTGWRALCSGLALVFLATALRATPILTVTGSGNLGHLIRPDQAAAVSFSLTRAFTGVSLTADLTSLAPPKGGVFLMNNLGPAAGIGNIVASADFNTISFVGANTAIFSNLSLPAGDYSVVVANDQSSTAGNVIWNGSTLPTVTAAAGVIDGIDFFSANTVGFPPSSTFATVLDRSAHFTVQALTGYALWASLNIPAGRDATFAGDWNGDGIRNGVAYVFGNVPITPIGGQAPGNGKIPAPPAIPSDVNVYLEWSASNLTSWEKIVSWANGAAPVFKYPSFTTIAAGFINDSGSPKTFFYRYRVDLR